MRAFYSRHPKAVSLLIFAVSLIISVAVLFVPLDPQQLAVFGYAGIFVITLLGALSLFLPGPTMIAAFAIGSVLNPALVAVAAGLGSAIGETTGYAAGYAARAWISPVTARNSWYWRVLKWMTGYPFITLFLLSAIPNFITDVGGLVAGHTGYPYYKYLLATFLGKTVRFGLGAYLGAAVGTSWLRR